MPEIFFQITLLSLLLLFRTLLFLFFFPIPNSRGGEVPVYQRALQFQCTTFVNYYTKEREKLNTTLIFFYYCYSSRPHPNQLQQKLRLNTEDEGGNSSAYVKQIKQCHYYNFK